MTLVEEDPALLKGTGNELALSPKRKTDEDWRPEAGVIDDENFHLWNKLKHNVNYDPIATDDNDPLKVAAEKGLDLRSALGNKYSRSADAKSDAYINGNREEKAQMRKDWCEKKWEDKKTHRQKTVTMRQNLAKRGTWKSFFWIYKNEGLNDYGLAQAKLYSSKCVKLGPPWVKWNEMYERLDYLQLEEQYREDFETAWSMWVVETAPLLAGELEEPKASKEAATAKATSVEKQPQAKAKSAADPTASEKPLAKSKAKAKAKAGAESSAKECARMKDKYFKATAGAENLLQTMQTQEMWTWAKALDKDLKTALCTVKDFMTQNSFIQDYMSMDSKGLKSKHSADDISKGQATMVAHLGEMLDHLQEQTDMLVDMQEAKQNRKRKSVGATG